MQMKAFYKVIKGRSGPELRELFTSRIFRPIVEEIFKRRSEVKELQLCFAQYWDDEANDAVHDLYVVSDKTDLGWKQLFDPKHNQLADDDHYLMMNDIERSLFGERLYFDNDRFITAFACYTHDNGSQHNDAVENYSPYLIARRSPGGIEYTTCPMVRPELDGVRPEYESDDD